MTPLAHRIVKELTLPKRDRTFFDAGSLLPMMSDIHCFECSDVQDVAFDLVFKLDEQRNSREDISFGDTLFLPAEKTWIERRCAGGRIGVLLSASHEDNLATCIWATDGIADGGSHIFMSAPDRGSLLLNERRILASASLPRASSDPRDKDCEFGYADTLLLYAFLSIINTPRIIGRKQHMPHRGLERSLIAMRHVIGKFPLHAYTEIKLRVTPPKDLSSDRSREAHLTGDRALHFCRSHLRVRLGTLEVVKGHWRGDGSLGIRQSRYKLVA